MAKKRTHKWAFPLGLLIVALAVVGAVSLAYMAIGGLQTLLDNPAERAEFEHFLANIVARDPDPFDSPERVQENVGQLLDIALWALLRREDNNPADFPMDDDGNLVIPQEVAAEKFRLLFGIDPPAHATVEGDMFDFIYDPDEQVYRVPIAGELVIFIPRVTNVSRTGGRVYLTVDYLSYGDWNLDATNRPQELIPVKTMEIILIEQDNEDVPWQVTQIRHPLGVDVAAGTPVL